MLTWFASISGGQRRTRVLLVEDSFMSARSIVRLLQQSGLEVIGPAPSVARAMDLLDTGGCDAAVLDINLGNETAEPIAQRLADAGLPFIFVSGYSSPKLIDSRFKEKTLVPKPIDPVGFLRTVNEMLQGA